MTGISPENEYKPWEQFRETELEYFQRRYLEVRAEVERLKGENLALRDGWSNPAILHMHILRTLNHAQIMHIVGDDVAGEIRALTAELERVKLRDNVRDLELLDEYSRWLEHEGYMDSDWYTEANTPQDFLAARASRKEQGQ